MATETTLTSAAAWRPDVTFIPAAETIPDALVLTTATIAGRVEGDAPAVRVPFVDDAEASFVAEGETIDEADPNLAEVTVYTHKVGQLVRLSREQFVQASTSSLISASVQRAVVKKANAAYLSQPAPADGSTSPPAGLLNVPGITDGGAITGDLDRLVDAVTASQDADGDPTHIIASPSAWAALSKLKSATDSNSALLGAGTEAAERRILGIPVLVSNAMPPDELLVSDQTAVVAAAGDVAVATSSEAYFASDSIGVRVTFRFGQNVVHPERLVKLTATTEAI